MRGEEAQASRVPADCSCNPSVGLRTAAAAEQGLTWPHQGARNLMKACAENVAYTSHSLSATESLFRSAREGMRRQGRWMRLGKTFDRQEAAYGFARLNHLLVEVIRGELDGARGRGHASKRADKRNTSHLSVQATRNISGKSEKIIVGSGQHPMQARSIQTSIWCEVLEQGEEATAENSGANASVAGAGRRGCRLAERRARHARTFSGGCLMSPRRAWLQTTRSPFL